MRQVRGGIADDLLARLGSLVEDAANGGFDQVFHQALEARTVDRRERLLAAGCPLPSRRTRTVTSTTRSRIVPGRSGSAIAGSIPAASIAARPSSRRLVPAHRPALRQQPLPQLPAAAAATDDQRPRHLHPPRRDRARATAAARPRRRSPAAPPRSSPGPRAAAGSRSAPPSSGGCRRSRSAPRPRASGSEPSRRGRRSCRDRSGRRRAARRP